MFVFFVRNLLAQGVSAQGSLQLPVIRCSLKGVGVIVGASAPSNRPLINQSGFLGW